MEIRLTYIGGRLPFTFASSRGRAGHAARCDSGEDVATTCYHSRCGGVGWQHLKGLPLL